ncbi:MAG: hypothetical protein EBU08_22660 [Micrococcales bacterium]|jgi:hypothetical protein|nr:hypothetical protein [Micrococcales bacterium]
MSAEPHNNIDFWVSVGSGLTGVIAGMVAGVSYLKNRFKSWKKQEEIDAAITAAITVDDIRRYGQVQEILTTLRNQCGADRIQILQFHNGGKFLDGSSMKRMSVTHESCSNGVAYEYMHLQAVLATLLWEKIELVKKDEPQVHLVKNLSESNLRTYCRSKGTEAFAVLPIHKDALVIGFINLDWLDEETAPHKPMEFAAMFEEQRNYIELQLAKDHKSGN